MDERKLQAKVFQKAYKKERRRRTLIWDIGCWLAGLMLLGGLAAGLYVRVRPLRKALEPYWEQVKALLGMADGTIWYTVKAWAFPACAGLLGLWLLCLLLRAGAVRRAKKCDAYLNLQTMQRALKVEKEEASL